MQGLQTQVDETADCCDYEQDSQTGAQISNCFVSFPGGIPTLQLPEKIELRIGDGHPVPKTFAHGYSPFLPRIVPMAHGSDLGFTPCHHGHEYGDRQQGDDPEVRHNRRSNDERNHQEDDEEIGQSLSSIVQVNFAGAAARARRTAR